jgi:hypothetical protein
MNNERDMIPWRYCVITLIVGLILVVNFFMAARFHFKAIGFATTAVTKTKKIAGSGAVDDKLADSYEKLAQTMMFSGIGIALGTLVGFFIYEKRKFGRVNQTKRVSLEQPLFTRFLRISGFLFNSKTQKDTFELIVADWQEEYFEALKENKDANLLMINVRNTYGFIMAMWQKSPLGDLLEYVRKIAS